MNIKNLIQNKFDIIEFSKLRLMQMPYPGYYDLSRTPYISEILWQFSGESPAESIAIMKGVQVGLTAMCECVILFYLDQIPGSVILYVTADEGLAKEWSKNRLDPALESVGLTEKTQAVVQNKSSKKTGDTMLSKSFENGSRIRMTSYNKVASLRMDSVQILIMDELDAAPIEAKMEGDPRAIAEKRTAAYKGRKKIGMASTPLVMQSSKIYRAFLDGDQRYYYVPCPNCGTMQPLEWRNEDNNFHLKYEIDQFGNVIPESVFYECKNKKCSDRRIINAHKFMILPHGEWRTHNGRARIEDVSYHISNLYSPVGMDDWYTIAQEWIKATS